MGTAILKLGSSATERISIPMHYGASISSIMSTGADGNGYVQSSESSTFSILGQDNDGIIRKTMFLYTCFIF